jgi:dihydroflavonol-4-reductase
MKNDRALQFVPEGARITAGDLLDTSSLEEFFSASGDEETIVLHCASFVTVDPAWDQKVYDINVRGTANIIAMCLKHKVKKLVYVSSTGAIPELPKGEVIREIASFTPDAVIGCYAQTKAMATQLVMDAVHTRGLPASIIYPSGIAGPGDFSFGFFMQFIIDYARGKMPAGISGSFNLVDVRDLAEGIIACAHNGKNGEGYILSNRLVDMRELFRLLSRHTGVPEVKVILPVWAAKTIACIATLHSKLSKKPARFTAFSVYNLTRNNNFSCNKAKAELGYGTRPVDHTIADSIAWLREEGKISGT